jgi:hypothetical protein
MNTTRLVGYVIGISWISMIFGIALARVGQTPPPPTVLTMVDAIKILFIFLVPFLAGLLAGKSEK